MAEFYSTGTIQVTGGSTAFAGTGTQWLPINTKPGDVLNVAGHLMLIETLDDATHGAFAVAYPGLSASGLSYAILRTSAAWGTNRAVAVDTAELIKLLSRLGSTAVPSEVVAIVADGPARDALEDVAVGNLVIVCDIGDENGNAAYQRLDAADPMTWSAPAILTGPRGATVPEVLAELGITKITISTSLPTGGVDGQLWLMVEEEEP